MISAMMHRFEFQTRFAIGDVLDIGCADCAQWRFLIPQDTITNPPNIKSVILVDCDEWKNDMGIPFIRAFAENIPLPDQCADTCVYGDILEHVNDINIVLKEGKRLTRDRIIITVPNEWKWLKDSPYVKSFETREKHMADGKDMRKLSEECTIHHPSGACIDALNDEDFLHIHHQRFFNEETFIKLIEDNFESDQWSWHIYNIHYSGLNFVSLAAIIWRK